jgi:hypothetical protein
LGGKQGGKSKNSVNTAVVTPSASGRSSAKFPSIRETPKGKIQLRGTFCIGNTKASKAGISHQTENSPPPTEIRYPMGTPEKSFPDFRMYARWSATWLPLLWALELPLFYPCRPFAAQNRKKRRCRREMAPSVA